MGCASRGDAASLKFLLGSGAKADLADAYGLDASDEAARSGKRAALDILLAALGGAREKKEEALRQAAFAGRTELVSALMAEGVDPDAVSEGGASSIFLAAWRGQKETVDLLLKASAKGAEIDIDRPCRMAGRDALPDSLRPAEAAFLGGHADCAESLVAKGAGVDWDKAAKLAPPEARGALFRSFASKAGAEQRKKYGKSLLDRAAAIKDLESIRLFIAAGIDPTDSFNSALAWPELMQGDDVLPLLAAKSAASGLFSDAMQIAIEGGKPKLVKALLDAGVDPNGSVPSTWWDYEGPSYFKLAAFFGFPEIMRLLRAKGAKESLNPPELRFLKFMEK
jgi:ankyrin repeat protein